MLLYLFGRLDGAELFGRLHIGLLHYWQWTIPINAYTLQIIMFSFNIKNEL